MTDVINWPIIKDNVSRSGPLAMLLLGSARRVDSLALGQSGTTRRSVSFDVTVPTDLQVPLTDAEVQVLVPLALIEKGALRRVTAKDPSGHPLPILGAQDNSRLSAEMLLFMLDTTPGGLAAGYDAKLFDLLQQVVAFQPGTGSDEERTRLEAGIAVAAAQAKGYPAEVSELIQEIAKGFLDHFLLVAVPDSDLVGQRVVLKFSYDRDLPTLSPWNRNDFQGALLEFKEGPSCSNGDGGGSKGGERGTVKNCCGGEHLSVDEHVCALNPWNREAAFPGDIVAIRRRCRLQRTRRDLRHPQGLDCQ